MTPTVQPNDHDPMTRSFELGSYEELDRYDDEQLLDMLRSVAAVEDPVPDAVTAFARRAPQLIDLDVALAELLEESELSAAAGLRHGDGTHRYRFSLDGDSVSVDVLPDVVLGEFDAPGWSAEVVYPDGAVALVIDQQMFEFEARQPRFALMFTSGGRRLATEWLRA